MLKLPRSFALPLLLCIVVFAGAAQPNRNQAYIQKITYSGTGCPQGTVGQSISDDRQTFTLIFDSFVASVGPSIPLTEAAKNCQVDLVLHLPAGWTSWINASSTRGYVQLDNGSTATSGTVTTMPAPSSSPNSHGKSGVNESGQTTFTGPTAKDYLTRDDALITGHAPDTCDPTADSTQTLTFALGVAVSAGANPNAQGQITTDSFDGKLTQTAHVGKSCQ